MSDIYFLVDYNWELGTLIPTKSKKNLKIKDYHGFVRTVAINKTATPDELVCIVCETWNGVNWRGSYRVERTLYSESRVAAKLIARQPHGLVGRVVEIAHGIKANQP